MTSKEERARQVQQSIADVLRNHWDPIGIKDEPAAADEYDAYVGGVYRLIAAGVTPLQLAGHLANVEAERLGFPDTDPRMLIPVAEKLLRLNVRLESDGAA
jgi:hypothetical protein